jgi:hypothetical protein
VFEMKISEMKEYASLLVLVNFLMIDVFDEKFSANHDSYQAGWMGLRFRRAEFCRRSLFLSNNWLMPNILVTLVINDKSITWCKSQVRH